MRRDSSGPCPPLSLPLPRTLFLPQWGELSATKGLCWWERGVGRGRPERPRPSHAVRFLMWECRGGLRGQVLFEAGSALPGVQPCCLSHTSYQRERTAFLFRFCL